VRRKGGFGPLFFAPDWPVVGLSQKADLQGLSIVPISLAGALLHNSNISSQYIA
jgi:hypothetical protein